MKVRTTTVAAACVLALPAAAQAHVSLHPNTLPASSNPTLNVRVPNEEDKANVVMVDMQVPPGFTDIATQIPPGWKAKLLKRKLATPIKTDAGTITEEVSEIIWTAPRSGGIPPGSFEQFPILTAIPDSAAGQTLTFKVIETYSNGDAVRWIEAPDSTMHPAPTVNVTAKGGTLLDIAGTEAGPGPAPQGQKVASTKSSTVKAGASKGLGVAALVVGALGLLLGLVALAAARRSRPTAA